MHYCDFKQRYDHRKIAAKAAATARKRTGEDITAYRCPVHHCWHIGHTPGAERSQEFYIVKRMPYIHRSAS